MVLNERENVERQKSYKFKAFLVLESEMAKMAHLGVIT